MSRLTEWWRPKAGTILSLLLFYLALWDVPFVEGWKLLFFSVITLSGFGVMGYFLNDWADIPYDRKAGKTNLVNDIPPFYRLLILLGLIGITLLPWFAYFETDALSIALIAAQFTLQAAYPLPPVRLKNIPHLAILCDALYAFAIPMVLAWHTFDLTSGLNDNPGQFFHFIFLFVWMLALGVRQMLNHHVADMENDRASNTPNLALSASPLKLRSVVQNWLFPVELFAAIGFFAALFIHAGFLVLIPLILLAVLGARHLESSLPIFNVSFSKSELDQFSTFYLGIVAIGALTVFEPSYLRILPIFLLLFSDLFFHPLVSHIVKSLVEVLRNSALWLAKMPLKTASLLVNWSLYYFRKWVLRWPDERNFGEHYPDRLKLLAFREMRSKGIVAVFNQNENKYTETFVRGHLERLPFHKLFFHGWPAPFHVNHDEHLLSTSSYVRGLRYAIWQLLNLDPIQKENKLISSRLIAGNVRLMLAEFGTMGARIAPISVQTGIPLVVIFYGYDAWKKSTLEEHRDEYVFLFKTASTVIGVSQDMCRQLQRLGCPKEKIHYLPCYVDVSRFQFVERNFKEPNFLAIGRFCQTKAPQLTILAFQKVRSQIPNATLVMIGNDDGNGVLEMCLSLIKSLKLQDSITILSAVDSATVAEHMAKASIFVQHSVTTPDQQDKEGTPVAIMEAMASGLPVISTKHAGIMEVITNNETGILVNEFDHEEMAKQMMQLVQDPQRMTMIGKAASEAIHGHPLISRHIQELSQIIEKNMNR